MESLTSLFQCHLELQSGSLLYVSSMELPLPPPGLPQTQSLGCWFFWKWDNNLALSSWCPAWTIAWPHSSHNSHTAFSKFWGDAYAGAVPRGQTDTLEFSVFAKHWALQKEDWFWLKAVHGERKTPKSGAFFHSEGFAFLGDSCDESVCAAPSTARSHGFHPQLRIQLPPSAPQGWLQKRAAEPFLPAVREFG